MKEPRKITLWLIITACIVLLTWHISRNGRYQGFGGCFILDTRTGHLWAKEAFSVIDLGTLDNPTCIIIESTMPETGESPTPEIGESPTSAESESDTSEKKSRQPEQNRLQGLLDNQ